MNKPTNEQVEAAILREPGYWKDETLFYTRHPDQWLDVISEALGRATEAWTKHNNYQCLREILFIAAVAEAAVEDCDCKPCGGFSQVEAGLGPWLRYLNCFLENCVTIPGYAVGQGFIGIRFYAVQIMCQHGLVERSGYEHFCPNCGLQIKRMARPVGNSWELYWGCDENCQDKGFTLGDPDYFNSFWAKHEKASKMPLLSTGYQVWDLEKYRSK